MKIPAASDFKAEFASDVWREAAREICRRHEISFLELRRAAQGESIIFFVDDRFVLKIFVPQKRGFERETIALAAARTSIRIPEIVAGGEISGYKYLITTQLQGELMTRAMWLELPRREQSEILTELAEGLNELHLSDHSNVDFDWESFVARQAATCFERQKACGVNERVLAEIPSFLEENLPLLPAKYQTVFMHGDVHFGNLRLAKESGKWRISGIFDFADSLKGFREYEFLAIGILMIQGQGELQREFFRAFGYADHQITEEMRRRLMLLTMFYEHSDLRRYAVRLRPEAVEYSLHELERAIWNFC